MAPPENPIQIRYESNGIKPDLDAAGWHICYFVEGDINRRDEEYYFPCSNDHHCCGRECCETVVQAGFPIWLAWLLGILAFLLLLFLILCLLYFCLRTRKKPSPTPPPSTPAPVLVHEPPQPARSVQTYRRVPSTMVLRRISDSNLAEIRNNGANSPGNNTMTTVVTVEESDYPPTTRNTQSHSYRPPRTYRRQGQRRIYDWDDDDHDFDDFDDEPAPFVPSPMRESYETTPTPIRVSYHDESEITQEVRPLVSRVQTPEEHKARTLYYGPGTDRVASYNELSK